MLVCCDCRDTWWVEVALNLWQRLPLMSASCHRGVETEVSVVLGWPSWGGCILLLCCCSVMCERATMKRILGCAPWAAVGLGFAGVSIDSEPGECCVCGCRDL